MLDPGLYSSSLEYSNISLRENVQGAYESHLFVICGLRSWWKASYMRKRRLQSILVGLANQTDSPSSGRTSRYIPNQVFHAVNKLTSYSRCCHCRCGMLFSSASYVAIMLTLCSQSHPRRPIIASASMEKDLSIRIWHDSKAFSP